MEIQNYIQNKIKKYATNVQFINFITIATLAVSAIIIIIQYKLPEWTHYLSLLFILFILGYSSFTNLMATYKMSESEKDILTNPRFRPLRNKIITGYVYSISLVLLFIYVLVASFN
jgi:hypothetical protein